jgi:hypothetical protein
MENLWDQRYASDAYFYGTEPNEWFAEKLRILKTGKILLPAEGEGRNAVWAAMVGMLPLLTKALKEKLKQINWPKQKVLKSTIC